MEYLKFDYKLSIFLIIAFILMTVVGTLTHEFGHYAVSRLLGYKASINYQSTSHWDEDIDKFLSETYKRNEYEIKNDLDFPNKEKFAKFVAKERADGFWITLGGPLQTIITGTIGFFLLVSYRKKFISTTQVHFMGWVLIFMSLFWLRQVANLFMAMMISLIRGKTPMNGDEIRLAHHLGINIWTIQVITGIIGFVVLFFVLRFLPKKLVLTFVVSGLIGGVLGFYLWLIKFGQFIMP